LFRLYNASVGPVRDKRLSTWIGHGRRLTAAAGISAITLRCHDDTWKEIDRLMRGFRSWSAPEAVPGPLGGLVEARLSGAKTVAMLRATHPCTIGGIGYNRAVARRVYVGLTWVVDLVDPAHPMRPLPPVVLDDVAGGDAPARDEMVSREVDTVRQSAACVTGVN